MIIFYILFLTQAFEKYSMSAQAVSMGMAITASATGTDAIRFNPALLSIQTKSELAISYQQVLDGIEGLHNAWLGFNHKLGPAGIGIGLSEFGFSEQKEQNLTLACGFGLGNDLKLGAAGDLYLINNQRTSYGFAYGISFGFSSIVFKKWQLGVYAHDINQPEFSSSEYGHLPYELRAGIAYNPFQDIRSEFDLAMKDNELRYRFATELLLFRLLYCRVGVQTNPQVISGGTGFKYRFIAINYGVEHIPDLPLNHSVGIRVQL
ncbi:hypothetical protein A2Y85_00550 [candidate division WOR-3 bacterium RBG_13_43_14]|uniref:PorV/PorQ family protein n=1 Tax=candidate division WOR-3 bacterium RBG_13_43_14 TaxID=1802590 RepID=A0A1F4UEE4_UNCW3|nr:MAG: hypothetical protein A2Y85_00550 [candidate division WOR-3 bacterium RBG_13_43_14]